MSSAFVLALVSGFFHASWNALAKTLKHERAATLATLTVSFLVALVALGLWPGQHFTPSSWPWVLVAGGGEAAYVYCLGNAYQRGDLALTYTVSRAAALVFIWPLSWLTFGTVPGVLALVATALVALGIALGRRGAGGTGWAVGWTLATGASVGVYHTGYKGLVAAGTTPVAGFAAAIALALPLLFVAVGAEVRAAVPVLLRRPRLWLAGVLCAGSFLLLLQALTTSESGRILGVRNSSVGFALIISLVLGERLARRQWLGVAVLFVGVALFAFT